jgi:hypothetical protein
MSQRSDYAHEIGPGGLQEGRGGVVGERSWQGSRMRMTLGLGRKDDSLRTGQRVRTLQNSVKAKHEESRT